MKKKYRLNKVKFIRFICFTIMLLIIGWFMVSYIEILCKNITENPTYSDWNFIFVAQKLLK